MRLQGAAKLITPEAPMSQRWGMGAQVTVYAGVRVQVPVSKGEPSSEWGAWSSSCQHPQGYRQPSSPGACLVRAQPVQRGPHPPGSCPGLHQASPRPWLSWRCLRSGRFSSDSSCGGGGGWERGSLHLLSPGVDLGLTQVGRTLSSCTTGLCLPPALKDPLPGALITWQIQTQGMTRYIP